MNDKEQIDRALENLRRCSVRNTCEGCPFENGLEMGVAGMCLDELHLDIIRVLEELRKGDG